MCIEYSCIEYRIFSFRPAPDSPFVLIAQTSRAIFCRLNKPRECPPYEYSFRFSESELQIQISEHTVIPYFFTKVLYVISFMDGLFQYPRGKLINFPLDWLAIGFYLFI